MKKSRQDIILAVVFSVAIHIVLGITLFHNFSGNFSFSKSFNKLNLIWVTLETKNHAGLAAKDKRAVSNDNRDNAAQGAITKEFPEIKKNNRKGLETSPSPDFPGSVILAGYNGSVAAEAKGQVYNAVPSTSVETAGSLSVPGTDAYPQYLENVPPVYPQIARIRGYEGAVLISTEILPDGKVGSLRIKKSSGFAILDRAALEAVRNWKFEPARKMGKPYAIWRDHIIKFFLNDDNSQS